MAPGSAPCLIIGIKKQSDMELSELKVGQRVRVPATEKMGGGNHYAKITDLVNDPFTGEPLAIVFIPVTKQEKVLAIASISPDRKPKSTNQKPGQGRGTR